MNLTKTGKLISELRKEKGLTQKALAESIGICAKTVSKWETGRGFPDVTLISDLSNVLGVDISKLLKGEIPKSKPDAGNIKRMKFYVCKECGNILTSIAGADIICCGRKLSPLIAKTHDKAHQLNTSIIEDDFYITFPHPMTKDHYISFISYVRFDRVLTVKLYPEQGGEVRFPIMRGGRIYYYCSNHGLYVLEI